jgi:hypothetical protein
MKKLPKAYLLYSLVLMIVCIPLIEGFSWGHLIESALMTLVLLSAVMIVVKRRRELIGAIVLVGPAIVGQWLNELHPHLVPREIILGFGILFITFVVFRLIRFIFESPRVDSDVLCMGIAAYLILGLLWSLAYILVDDIIPNSFAMSTGDTSLRNFTALYYSFVTLATMGYGDIAPVSNIARVLAMAESVVGIFYTTILIARLVALYSAHGAFGHISDSVSNSDQENQS